MEREVLVVRAPMIVLQERVQAARSVEDLAEVLLHLLNSNLHVWEESDGKKILISGRAVVEKVDGLKIEVYADEHSPPHFHLRSANIDATFTISDCTQLTGKNVPRRILDLI